MEITLQKYELRELLDEVASRAADKAVKQYRREVTLEERMYICQNEAYRLYGEGIVRNWVKNGLIKRIKDGDRNSKVRYDKILLEELAFKSNRQVYIGQQEEKEKKKK